MRLTEKNKKILIIIGFVILVILLAWVLYLLFFAPNKQATEIPTDTTAPPITGGLPDTGEQTDNRQVIIDQETNLPINTGDLPYIRTEQELQVDSDVIVNHQVSTVSKSSNGSLVYYNKDDGKFYTYKSGEIEPLSDKSFYNVDDIAWSKQGNRAILEYPDGNNILYDFDKQKQISLPKEMTDFSFSQSGEKIVAKVISDFPDENWLVTTNYDGSDVFFVEHIGDKGFDVQVDWSPAGEIVATYREGIDFERQEVYPIGQSGANIKSLTTDGRGFESQWSPQGDFILYSVYNTKSGYRPSLYLADMGGDWTGSYKIDIGLNTWSDKCIFTDNSQKVYCAAPENLPELSGIFRELGDESDDVFYEINLVTGNKKIIAIPEGVSATGLQISLDKQTLYFVNSLTGNLEKIDLP